MPKTILNCQEPSTTCGLYENKTEQRCDWSYRYSLCQKVNWTVIDQLNQIRSIMKTKQDNDLINHTCIIYDENYIKLLGPIGSSAVCDENQIRQWPDWSYRSCLCWNQNWTILINQKGCQQWWNPVRSMTWIII